MTRARPADSPSLPARVIAKAIVSAAENQARVEPPLTTLEQAAFSAQSAAAGVAGASARMQFVNFIDNPDLAGSIKADLKEAALAMAATGVRIWQAAEAGELR